MLVFCASGGEGECLGFANQRKDPTTTQIELNFNCLSLATSQPRNRAEEDDTQKCPYTTTDVQLQPLTLPKAEVYMTVGKCRAKNGLGCFLEDLDGPIQVTHFCFRCRT
jgi:hypothetical protein